MTTSAVCAVYAVLVVSFLASYLSSLPVGQAQLVAGVGILLTLWRCGR
jgi:hypothetical protein